MSFANECWESGRLSGRHERFTGATTECPFAQSSVAARWWWHGYNRGLEGKGPEGYYDCPLNA